MPDLSIKLGHDGVTEGSGWYVKEVDVDMPTKGKRYFFNCKQWLAKDKDDGKIVRTFKHMDDSSSVSYKPSKYNNNISVYGIK